MLYKLFRDDQITNLRLFKLNKPIPEDLVPILAKDEDKQKAIREKASRDAASNQARVIGASTPATASRGVLPPGKHTEATRKPIAQLPASKTASNVSNLAALAQAPPASASVQKIATITAPSSSSTTPGLSTKAAEPGVPSASSKKINMVIQVIPPFKGSKKQGAPAPGAAPTTAAAKPPAPGANGHGPSASNASAAPISPIAANRLNVNAPSFRSKVRCDIFDIYLSGDLRYIRVLFPQVSAPHLRPSLPSPRLIRYAPWTNVPTF